MKKALINSATFLRWWLNPGSNWGHKDFQSFALPTELSSQMAELTGIEPAVFSVTGRHVNRYTTVPLVAGGRFELPASGLWARRATRLLYPAIIRWRRLRDSNSCGTCIPYQFSRLDPSTTWVSLHKIIFVGGPYRIRTYNQPVMSRELWPLS